VACECAESKLFVREEVSVQTQKKQWERPRIHPLKLDEARTLIERALALIDDDGELSSEYADLRWILSQIDENLQDPH